MLFLADWTWLNRLDLPSGVESVRRVGRWLVFGGAALVAILAVLSCSRPSRRQALPAVASAAFLPVWLFSVFACDALEWDALRVQCAEFGLWIAYLGGLAWCIWGLERLARHYESRRRDGRGAPAERSGLTPAMASLNWNPLDLDAWFYRLSAADWFNPVRFRRVLNAIRLPDHAGYGEENRRLNQSLAGFCGYSLAFYLLFLLMTQVGGCSETFDLPSGGGKQAQLTQQVKVQKVIKKKFVINPFSAIKFKVPPIDEVKLQLTEITKHAYQVGYGEGAGAGYAGGTRSGKVRFVRLQYSGGDWDQDFGVGADLNMLIQYGVRTNQPIAKETESRTIGEIGAVPIGKGPSWVFMTGQRNITLSAQEVRILRTYLTDKHGFLFCDNGGSAHFHNQFFAMMNQVLPNVRPVTIPLDDVIHRIPYQIPFLPYVAPHGGRDAYGWKIDGRWVAYYHPGDIGDAWSDGHSGVKPEVWEACYQLGANVIQYANAEYSKWLLAQQQEKKK